MIELTDTNSAGIAAEFVRARTRAGSPGHGHGDDAGHRRRRGRGRATPWRRPGRPRTSTPRGCSASSSGTAAGTASVNAQVGTGAGWTGETALIRLKGEVVKHPESVVLPLLLPDSPVAMLVARRPAGRPGRRPARRARPAPDHRRRRASSAAAPRAHPPASARRTPRATPTWPGPGSPRGGRCSRRRWTSTR